MPKKDAISPGAPIHLRTNPLEIIANQLISINTHLATIAMNIQYLTEEFKNEREE